MPVVRVAVLVNLHHEEGRLPVGLPRVGKAARIQDRQVRADIDVRYVGVTKHDHIYLLLQSTFSKITGIPVNMVSVSVHDHHPVVADLGDDLRRNHNGHFAKCW